MEYTMRLSAKPFKKLAGGSKKVELRLYDEKRKQLRVGDTITFFSTNDPNSSIQTRITGLYLFDSFEELYKNIPIEDLGYDEEELPQASPNDMDAYYTPEEQAKYGVIAIRLSLLSIAEQVNKEKL